MKKVTSEEIRPVEQVPFGEFVRKVDKSGKPQGKVYSRDEYIREERKYILSDVVDVGRCVLVKRGALVLVGFTY